TGSHAWTSPVAGNNPLVNLLRKTAGSGDGRRSSAGFWKRERCLRRVYRFTDGLASIVEPETREHGRIGCRLGGGTDCARCAMCGGFDVADKVVMAEWQERRRQDVERENDLQPKAEGPAKGRPRYPHLHFRLYGPVRRERKTAPVSSCQSPVLQHASHVGQATTVS